MNLGWIDTEGNVLSHGDHRDRPKGPELSVATGRFGKAIIVPVTVERTDE